LQEIGLKFKDSKKKGLFNVHKFCDIGLAWKCYASHDQAVKVNDVVYGTFDDESGYEYYLEFSIMKKLRLKYENNVTSNTKRCIVRMIVNSKCVLTNLINKRVETLHRKIIAKRTSAQDGKRNAQATFTYLRMILMTLIICGSCEMEVFVIGQSQLRQIIMPSSTWKRLKDLKRNWRQKNR